MVRGPVAISPAEFERKPNELTGDVTSEVPAGQLPASVLVKGSETEELNEQHHSRTGAEQLPLLPLDRWKLATKSIEGILSDYCHMVIAVEEASRTATDLTWRIIFPPGANQACDYCDHATRKSQLISAVANLCRRSIQLNFEVQPGQPVPRQSAPASSSAERQKKMRELMEIPLIKKICETLDAEIVKMHSSHQPRPHLNLKKEVE